MKKIAVVTSGGDVPGLNAALHAVVLTAMKHNVEIIGVNNGYDGLIDGKFTVLDFERVRNIMDEGGTILRTSRSKRFTTSEGRREALHQLRHGEVDGLIVIGGNGSLQGIEVFASEHSFPVMAIPKTIDNDVFGTDFAIGFDTATNTIVEAIDRIKDTADSTSRLFIVEVMGRSAGFLALNSGIAVAADAIVVPEIKPDLEKLLSLAEHNLNVGNRSMIIVITENTLTGGAMGLKKIMDDSFPQFDSRVTILGHIQRGGSPSAFDRTLASLLSYSATEAFIKGKHGVMAGYVKGEVIFTPLNQVAGKINPLNNNLMKLAAELSILV